jgi:hypothetical protein
MGLDPSEMGEKEGKQMKLSAAIHQKVLRKPRRACPVLPGCLPAPPSVGTGAGRQGRGTALNSACRKGDERDILFAGEK